MNNNSVITFSLHVLLLFISPIQYNNTLFQLNCKFLQILHCHEPPTSQATTLDQSSRKKKVRTQKGSCPRPWSNIFVSELLDASYHAVQVGHRVSVGQDSPFDWTNSCLENQPFALGFLCYASAASRTLSVLVMLLL